MLEIRIMFFINLFLFTGKVEQRVDHAAFSNRDAGFARVAVKRVPANA